MAQRALPAFAGYTRKGSSACFPGETFGVSLRAGGRFDLWPALDVSPGKL